MPFRTLMFLVAASLLAAITPAAATTYVQYELRAWRMVLDYSPVYYFPTYTPKITYYEGSITLSYGYETPSSDMVFGYSGFDSFQVTFDPAGSFIRYASSFPGYGGETLSVTVPGGAAGSATNFDRVSGSSFTRIAAPKENSVVTGGVTGIVTRFSNQAFGGPAIQVSLAQVPEPASWATMLAGFAMIGGVMRMRKLRPLPA